MQSLVSSKPSVLAAERDCYERYYANIHRGVFPLAQEATEAFEARLLQAEQEQLDGHFALRRMLQCLVDDPLAAVLHLAEDVVALDRGRVVAVGPAGPVAPAAPAS